MAARRPDDQHRFLIVVWHHHVSTFLNLISRLRVEEAE
jgi:hypothetical protein